MQTPKGKAVTKKILTKHGFKGTPHKWQHIFNLIKNIKKNPKSLSQLKGTLRKAVPSLRSHFAARKNSGAKTPGWFSSFKKIIKKPNAKSKPMLKKIKNLLMHNGFKITKPKWKYIKKNIKNGNAFHTPAFRRQLIGFVRKKHSCIKKTKIKKRKERRKAKMVY